jgi:hypothetical protein
MSTHELYREMFAGSLREELEKRAGYREGGSFTHEGVEYDLDSALRASERRRVRRVPVSELDWVLEYDSADPARVSSADTRAPLLVTRTRDGRLTTVDGLHRLTKLKRRKAKFAPVRYVSRDELEKVSMNFGFLGRARGAVRGVKAPAPPVGPPAPPPVPQMTIPPHLGGPTPSPAQGLGGKARSAWESARYHTAGMFGSDGIAGQARRAAGEYMNNPVARQNVHTAATNTMYNAAHNAQQVMSGPAGQFIDDAAGVLF